jgi:FtsH-binding integral membrane protein
MSLVKIVSYVSIALSIIAPILAIVIFLNTDHRLHKPWVRFYPVPFGMLISNVALIGIFWQRFSSERKNKVRLFLLLSFVGFFLSLVFILGSSKLDAFVTRRRV